MTATDGTSVARAGDARTELAVRAAAERPRWRGMKPERLWTLLRAEPGLGAALSGLGEELLAELAPRTLELVALRTSAANEGCGYVWSGHVQIALHLATGALSEEDIARVAVGLVALSGRDRAVVAAVDELLEEGRLHPDTAARLAGETLGVTIATFFYATVAALTAGLEPEPDAIPVTGLETPERARETGEALLTRSAAPGRSHVGRSEGLSHDPRSKESS